MFQKNRTFKAAELSNQFKTACIQFDTLLALAKSKELATVRQKLHDELQDYKQRGTLAVAFIGQYSLGSIALVNPPLFRLSLDGEIFILMLTLLPMLQPPMTGTESKSSILPVYLLTVLTMTILPMRLSPKLTFWCSA